MMEKFAVKNLVLTFSLLLAAQAAAGTVSAA